MLTFKSTGKPAKVYYTTPDTKYMPAKLMYGENMATGYDTITETGETVTLLGDYNKGLVSLRIDGKTEQSGNPSVENPQEFIDFAGGEVVCRGKNLLSYPFYHTTRTVNGVTFTDNGDGSVKKHQLISEISLPSSGWNLYKTNGDYCSYTTGIVLSEQDKCASYSSGEGLCTHFPWIWYDYASNTACESICFTSSSINVAVKVNGLSTVADFQSFLASEADSGTPVKLKYIRAYPVVTDITSTDLGQALLEINTVYGQAKTLRISDSSMTLSQFELNKCEIQKE